MKKSSKHAATLYKALIDRKIKCEKEKWDEHKHIDISIDEARIYIEVDGDNHYTDPSQIKRDIVRDYYSINEGFRTIHIPNRLIDDKLNEVADAIAQVARDCINYTGKKSTDYGS